MSQTWNEAPPPEPGPIGLGGWLRVLGRGLLMAILVFGGALILLALRLIERPIFGMHRPWTPHITRFACRGALWIMGLLVHQQGQPMAHNGALVVNHSSWLDIFVLNSRDLVYFVSKSEVSGWPGIGFLARITGTVFIERDRRRAKAQTLLFVERLQAGHRLLFFPEGTSTDNQRILPFRTTLFESFFTARTESDLHIQPVTANYLPPAGGEARFYGWWGDMDFASNLLLMLSTPRHGTVKLTYHPPLAVRDFENRKALARACEESVRAAHTPSQEAG